MDFERLLETFAVIEDWEERYAIIIDLGNKLPPMPEELKTEESKVTGCISQVWMVSQQSDDASNTFSFIADSDSHIVKGLIAILHIIYSGRPVSEISSIDINQIFTQLGLEQHLSPNRRNGFYSMVEKIKALSLAV
jgi:cysteine desulfuration protein SufE